MSANAMLEALKDTNRMDTLQDTGTDHDFGKVLDSFGASSIMPGYEIKYSDGQKRTFSFD